MRSCLLPSVLRSSLPVIPLPLLHSLPRPSSGTRLDASVCWSVCIVMLVRSPSQIVSTSGLHLRSLWALPILLPYRFRRCTSCCRCCPPYTTRSRRIPAVPGRSGYPTDMRSCLLPSVLRSSLPVIPLPLLHSLPRPSTGTRWDASVCWWFVSLCWSVLRRRSYLLQVLRLRSLWALPILLPYRFRRCTGCSVVVHRIGLDLEEYPLCLVGLVIQWICDRVCYRQSFDPAYR